MLVVVKSGSCTRYHGHQKSTTSHDARQPGRMGGVLRGKVSAWRLTGQVEIILPATFHPVEVEILGNTNSLLKPRQLFQPSPHFHCRNLPAGRAAKGPRLPSSWQKYAKMLLNIVQSLGMTIDSALPED